MSAIVNARDVLLQSAPVRNTNPRAGKSLQLNVSSLQFKVAAGVAAPAAIAIDVVLNGLTGTPTFAVTGASKLIGSAGLSRTLSYADVTADAVQITASLVVDGQAYTATQTVVRVFDGVKGDNGAAGLSNAIVHAFKRAAAVPDDRPGEVTYTFASASITSPAVDALGNGWSKKIPAGTDPLYICYASASGAGATDVIAATEWTAPALLAQNGQSGANGMNSATVYIYRRTDSAAAPALPTDGATYTFSTASLAGLNNDWTTSVPAAGGAYLWISTATAASASASDVIAPGEWAEARLMAKDGSNGQPGNNGVSFGTARCYKWSIGSVPTIVGTGALNFLTGVVSDIPADWSATKPAPPSKGATLYEASVQVTDVTGAESKSFSWGSASISSIGYVGLDGEGGKQGASSVIAYCLVDGSSLDQLPALISVDGNSLPPNGAWGAARAWQVSPPAAAAGQTVMQSNGVYNPATDKTVWAAPLLASWRVGELSAISANLGEVTAGRLISVSPDGYKTVISPAGIVTYWPNGNINVRIGWWT